MRVLLCSTAMMAVAAIGSAASAQEAPPAPGPATGTETPSSTSPNDPAIEPLDEGGIADIVVTAQLRQENMQDVPISVSAVDGDALRQSNITSLQDLSGSIPSLVVSRSASYGLAPISIRGLGGPAGGGSAFSSQPVAVYVDSVYVPALAQSVSDFLDLDSVQVLRGPQGTLYGRNSTSGAILLTSKRPRNEFEGDVTAGIGSFDEFKVSGAVNIPIIDDALAVRLALGHNSGGDWARNSVDGRRFGGGESTTGRASVRWRASDAITFTVIGEHAEAEARPAVIQLSSATLAFRGPGLGFAYVAAPFERRADFDDDVDARRTQITAPQYTDTKASNISALLDWEIGALTLSSISGYRKFKVSGEQYATPFTTPAATIGTNDTVQHQKSYSQELRLAAPQGEPFKWTVGLYYFRQETDAIVNIRNLQGGPPVATGFGPTGPIFAGRIAGTQARFLGEQDIDSYAAFADGTYQFSDAWSLTAGIRYSRDKKSAAISQRVTTINPTVIAGPVLSEAQCPRPGVSCSRTFSNVSPRVVLNFQPSRDNMFYASYSKGFNSGGFNPFGNVANPVDPTNPLENDSEKITNYEIGTKNDLFDRRVRLNISAFQTDYDDLQIRQAVFTGGVSLVNVPKSRVKGIEVESVIKPIDKLTLALNGAYLDAKIRRGQLAALASNTGTIVVGQNVTVILEDVSGNRLTRAPKWQGYASATWSEPMSFGSVDVQGTFRFSSDTFYSETNQDTDQYREGAWQEFDLRLALNGLDDRWSIALLGRNLFDKQRLTQIVPYNGFPIGTLSSPRSINLSGTVRF